MIGQQRNWGRGFPSATDFADAMLRFDPDVVVLDIAMPVLDGIQASSHVHESNGRTKLFFDDPGEN